MEIQAGVHISYESPLYHKKIKIKNKKKMKMKKKNGRYIQARTNNHTHIKKKNCSFALPKVLFHQQRCSFAYQNLDALVAESTKNKQERSTRFLVLKLVIYCALNS